MSVTRSGLALLRECVRRHVPELEPLLDRVGIVARSQAGGEELRGSAAAELCETGLDSKGGHNQRDIALDDLIDSLGNM